MQVAKIGLLGKMLLVLKLTEPTDYAFDKMLSTAYLSNSDIFVEQLDLSGKSLSLRGSGKVRLGLGTLDLAFNAAGERLANKNSGVIKSLADGFAPAVMRIKVTGNIKDPQIEETTLPVIQDALSILGTRPRDKRRE